MENEPNPSDLGNEKVEHDLIAIDVPPLDNTRYNLIKGGNGKKGI